MSDDIVRNEMDERGYLQNDYITKSNLLISAKYKASLQALRINYINQYKLQKGQYYEDPETKELVVELYPSEILSYLEKSKGGSLYESLESVAFQMTSTVLGVSDPIKERFDYISIVTRSTYEDGVLTTKYHPAMKKHLINLKDSFTQLNRLAMVSWKSSATYRLYEELKKRSFYPKSYKGKRNGIFVALYDVYELRLLLGVVNSNLDSVRKVLEGKNPPDYKKACEASPEQIYKKWSDFRKYVIDKGIAEINNNVYSDITVTYETQKKSHGEVYAVKFTIRLKEYINEEEEYEVDSVIVNKDGTAVTPNITAVELFLIQRETIGMLEPLGIGTEDAISICQKASYQIETIKKAVELLKKQKHVDNVVGWLISAIQNNYSEPVTFNGKKKTKNQFLEFEQREYPEDFWDNLEKEMANENRFKDSSPENESI